MQAYFLPLFIEHNGLARHESTGLNFAVYTPTKSQRTRPQPCPHSAGTFHLCSSSDSKSAASDHVVHHACPVVAAGDQESAHIEWLKRRCAVVVSGSRERG